MLSVRELDLDKNPNATGWVNQRIIYTHGIGVAMVPGQRGRDAGPARAAHPNLPPVSSRWRAAEITEPRIYFGERPTAVRRRRRAPGRVRLPARRRRRRRRRPDDAGRDDRDPARHDLSRLLFALRFRDFDLLISDQVTNDSQLLFHRTLADRLPRIAPFLRYDKDPYLVIDGDGRLVYIQDAYTTSDRSRTPRRSIPDATLAGRPASAASRSTTSGTA